MAGSCPRRRSRPSGSSSAPVPVTWACIQRKARTWDRRLGGRMREARRPQWFDQAERWIAADERRGAERLPVRLASSGMIAVWRLAPSAGSAGRGLASRLGGCFASCRAGFSTAVRPSSNDESIGRQADAAFVFSPLGKGWGGVRGGVRPARAAVCIGLRAGLCLGPAI